MNSTPYTPPQVDLSAFHCPQCNAYAAQNWSSATDRVLGGLATVPGLKTSYCAHCGERSIWFDGCLIIPYSGASVPHSHPDLPENIKADFEEARAIVGRSPRGAAALLRLAIQKLCIALGEKGSNINNDIAALVSKGLSRQIQQALDFVRVVGNEAVHPGTLDLNDDPEIALSLFELVNLVVDEMIARPKRVDEAFSKLPAQKLKQIEERDSKTLLAPPKT